MVLSVGSIHNGLVAKDKCIHAPEGAARVAVHVLQGAHGQGTPGAVDGDANLPILQELLCCWIAYTPAHAIAQ